MQQTSNSNMAWIQFYTVVIILVSLAKSSTDTFKVSLKGSSRRSGIVGQQEGMRWKPLCGKVCWTNENANVTCNELGFGGGIMSPRPTDIEDPTMVRYQCKGTESKLHDCNQLSRCPSQESCSVGAEVTCQGAVRLNDYNSSSNRGRVEVFLKNSTNKYEWRGVCGNCWSQTNTNVVCKQFKYRFGVMKEEKIEKASSTIWEKSKYTCSGHETDLSDCLQRQACEACNTSGVVVTCSNEEIDYNQPCEIPQSCKEGLVCKDVCTCENESSLFWSEREQKCTEKLNFNETCTDKTNCIGDLVCKNVGNHLCRCQDETNSFWNSEEKICKEKIGYNKPCEIPQSCKEGLVCKDKVCTCENESSLFWSEGEQKCTEKIDYNQPCEILQSCKEGLVCKDNVCTCENESSLFWSEREQKCTEISSINGTCESDDHCIRNLVCKGTGNRYCKCGTDFEFWDARTDECQQRSSFSAVFVSTVQTFEAAVDFCSTNHSGNLASSEEVQRLFPECLTNNTYMWLDDLQSTKQDEISQEELCSFGIELNGVLYVHNKTNCSETYSFLCVSHNVNGTNSTNSSNCRPSIRLEPVDKETVLPLPATGNTDPLLWTIYVGVFTTILVIILIVAGLCYRRRRNRKLKHGPVVSCDKQNVDLNYSEAVLENEYSLSNLNGTGNQTNNRTGQGQLTNDEEGVYSLAQSNFSGPSSGSTTQTTETDNYGYGLLGVKRADNDDNGMYSHTKRMNDTGEYDTFDKRDRDRDVNDVYDHTRGLTMENQYDEVQKRK